MKLTRRVWNARNATFDTTDGSDREAVAALSQPDDALVWVDVLDPPAAEFERFAADIGLDKLAVEDALTLHERPKSYHSGHVLFITAYAVTETGETSRISMFVFDHAMLTVRLGTGFDAGAVAREAGGEENLLRLGSRALEMMILDAIVDGYTAWATDIDERVDEVEAILFDNRSTDVSQQTFTLHKDVSALRKIVLPMRDVVSSMVRRVGAEPGLSDLVPYAEDVYDHTMRATDWTEMLRDAVESVRSTNLALVDNQLNTVMKKLTGWAAIIAIPTAITGYFGQNVPYPGFGKQWGFWLSVVIMVVLAAALYTTFKRRNWL